MVKWVLGEISGEKLKEFNDKLPDAVGATEEIIENGVDSAMNKYSH